MDEEQFAQVVERLDPEQIAEALSAEEVLALLQEQAEERKRES